MRPCLTPFRAVWTSCPSAVVAAAFVFSAILHVAAQTVLVPAGAGWRYLDNGTDQGTQWKELDYNDDGWGFGHAELGYGDDVDLRPETTVIGFGPDPQNKYITTYFRRFFFVNDATAISNLTVRLLRDDGGVVYLNGVEVFRSGMPGGPVNYRTSASEPGAIGDEETTFFAGSFDPGMLLNGINLIAVEIHQAQPDSDDLSFDLELVANEPPPPVALVRGPYLQSGTTSNLIVRWRTDVASPSRVQFGLTAGALDREVLELAVTTEHLVTLTNLAPDTKYYYVVGTRQADLAGGADHYFITAPVGAKPTRIWAIGDSGTAALGNPASGRVRDAYYAFAGNRETDVWLMLGDNAYNYGTDAQYQTAVFNTYQNLLRHCVLWSTLGNHETYAPLIGQPMAYFDILSLPTAGQAGGIASGTENYYSFDYGNIHFVCLDSELSGRSSNSPMLTWLRQDLDANTNDWLIAFWHSPPYTKGSHDSDNLDDNFGNMTQMRTNIVPILEEYGVDLVLCGHSHDYERSYLMDGHYGFSATLVPGMIKDAGSGRANDTGAYLKPSLGPAPHQGAVYVVAGSSGQATFQTGRHPIMYAALLQLGSLVIDIDGYRLDAKFLRETGAIDDYFTIIKGARGEPLRLATFRIANGEVIARWKSFAGIRYQVESTPTLENPQWSAASGIIEATGATSTWTNPIPADVDRCFYRVVEITN